MTPVSTALAAGVLIVLGKWARGKGPTVENGIGIAGIAIMLALIEQANAKLAAAFGALILVSLSVVHMPTIVKAAGFGKK